MAATTTQAATTDDVPAVPEVATTTESRIREAFPEAPEQMVSVARCESGLRQFEADGVTPLAGRRSSDLGLFQVNRVHWAEARALGYDLATEEGNTAFARRLFDQRRARGQSGLEDWVCARTLGLL